MKSKPLRTVIVTSNFPPVRGGSCVVYDRLARNANGAIVVLAPQRDYRTHAELAGHAEHDSAARYRVWRLPLLRPYEKAPGPGVGRSVADLRVMLRVLAMLAWICTVARIDVVCIGDLVYGGWLIWPVRLLLRRRVLVYIHGEELTGGGAGLSERMKGRFLRAADGVVAVSGFARDAAIRLGGADPARVRVVLNGVDTELFHRRPPDPGLRAQYGLAGKRVLLTVARLVERKGIDAVIRALPQMLSVEPEIHYLVVGDGPDRPRLERLIEATGMTGHVTLTGPVSDAALVLHYSIGDLFVMPNRALANGDNEGFGLVFLEANASGLAVVAGRAGGTADAVHDGRNGLLVDGTDIPAIAETVLRLLGDDALRDRMACTGEAMARESGWERRVVDFQAAVASVCAGSAPQGRAAPASSIGRLAPTPRAAEIDLSAVKRPLLLVLVDAEEEFDWHQISSAATSVRSMRHQVRAHRIFERYGLRPMYLADYPVVMQPEGYGPLGEWLASGVCDVGTQLHPWVSPPIEEAVSEYTSFPGNLPEALERAKLRLLTEAIEDRFGRHPLAYRAGRYGAGPNTARILADLGYRVDCSVLPYTDFSGVGGPDYSDWSPRPAWLDPERRLLELPATVGFAGRLSRRGDPVYRAISLGLPTRLRVPGIFARLGLLERIKLTPEGTSLVEAKRLTRAMLAEGNRVFAITYHSPSLEVGHTPYVRSQADLARFLDWLDGYCAWFTGEIGGVPSTAAGVYDLARGEIAATRKPELAAAVPG